MPRCRGPAALLQDSSGRRAGRTANGPGSARAALTPERGPPVPAAGNCSPRAGSCRRTSPPPRARPAPAWRYQRPRTPAQSRGVTVASRKNHRGPGRADDPLPPAERLRAVSGDSLTRAMVAVAILRPSRPPGAPHGASPSAVSRDLGITGDARERWNSRDKSPFCRGRDRKGTRFRCRRAS